MNKINLYTGGGISLSPFDGEDRVLSSVVRLVADEGRGITDGQTVTTSIDTRNPDVWIDCDLPEETPAEEEPSAEELLDIIMGGSL